MDRVPCRVSADLRKYMSEQGRLLDLASYMEQAHEEVIERLLEGKQVGLYTLEGVLDYEIDSNVRATVGELTGHLVSILDWGKDESVHGERRAKLREWLLGMVERFIDRTPEIIEERAAELAEAEAAAEPEYEPKEG